MIATMRQSRYEAFPNAFRKVMQMLSFCSHANVGWPIRCGGETIPSQHRCDCGAQRTYSLQPTLQKGPRKRKQPCVSYPLEVASAADSRLPRLSPGTRHSPFAA